MYTPTHTHIQIGMPTYKYRLTLLQPCVQIEIRRAGTNTCIHNYANTEAAASTTTPPKSPTRCGKELAGARGRVRLPLRYETNTLRYETPTAT